MSKIHGRLPTPFTWVLVTRNFGKFGNNILCLGVKVIDKNHVKSYFIVEALKPILHFYHPIQRRPSSEDTNKALWKSFSVNRCVVTTL